MKHARSLLTMLILAGSCGSMSGCNFLHELQPHRLHRWNQFPPETSNAYNFSIADPPLPDSQADVEDLAT